MWTATVIWQIFNLILQIAILIAVCYGVRALIRIIGDNALKKKNGKSELSKK